MSLATRFALAGGVVLVAAAIAVGSFVTSRIEDSVVRNTAIATALYMESFVSPVSQQLETDDHLSLNARRALEEVFTNTPLGERIVSYKLWKQGGLIVEASDQALVDQVFEPNDALRRAWEGEVSATFQDLGDAEDATESRLDLPLLEIYSPIRQVWSGEVIAVAEFYEINEQLRDDLTAARRSAWAGVTGVGLGIGAALYLIVLSGSRTIDRQKRDLDRQFRDLRALSGRNRDLRLRVQEAASRAATSTEHSLRRVGADLHDGPAQDLAFAALRLDDLHDAQTSDTARTELEGVAAAVARAMTEVRAISRGLTLPDIADRLPCEILHRAVDEHVSRTGLAVEAHCDCPDPPDLDQAARICIFRFVQEGLNNAFRHGGGAKTRVTLTCRDGTLDLRVTDDGPGFGDTAQGLHFGLGLTGLRDRVESLGGMFGAANHPGGGGEIRMTFKPGGEA
jgi:signal transduction histidine kinase